MTRDVTETMKKKNPESACAPNIHDGCTLGVGKVYLCYETLCRVKKRNEGYHDTSMVRGSGYLQHVYYTTLYSAGAM